MKYCLEISQTFETAFAFYLGLDADAIEVSFSWSTLDVLARPALDLDLSDLTSSETVHIEESFIDTGLLRLPAPNTYESSSTRQPRPKSSPRAGAHASAISFSSSTKVWGCRNSQLRNYCAAYMPQRIGAMAPTRQGSRSGVGLSQWADARRGDRGAASCRARRSFLAPTPTECIVSREPEAG